VEQLGDDWTLRAERNSSVRGALGVGRCCLESGSLMVVMPNSMMSFDE
jgi:hypothetical protein